MVNGFTNGAALAVFRRREMAGRRLRTRNDIRFVCTARQASASTRWCRSNRASLPRA